MECSGYGKKRTAEKQEYQSQINQSIHLRITSRNPQSTQTRLLQQCSSAHKDGRTDRSDRELDARSSSTSIGRSSGGSSAGTSGGLGGSAGGRAGAGGLGAGGGSGDEARAGGSGGAGAGSGGVGLGRRELCTK